MDLYLARAIYDALTPIDDMGEPWPLIDQLEGNDFVELADNIGEMLTEYEELLDVMRPLVKQFLVDRGYLREEEGT